jgi:biotin carboxyl carrier protein
MPGLILRLNRKKGEMVVKGDPLVLLEAMKMENEIRSPADGIVSEIFVPENSSVEKNQLMLKIKK